MRELLRMAVMSVAFFWIGLTVGAGDVTGDVVRNGVVGTVAAAAAFAVVWFVRRGARDSSEAPQRPS
ncbi:MAG: hypothetical protein ACI379_16215 [Nocardioides sp.]|uniref:hypothetical protein n=1 Tax=Nocardioides sp. TaxID=35761 RepID=UPI003F054772